jgi:mannose/fructose/N-acetylgalactosamine-specific phosphotransferase system component IID
MDRLTGREFWRMALRANLLQATWNYERQQGLGWAFCLRPALERLYPDAETRRARLAEHTAYFNTEPTLASFALGAVAALEEQRAAGGEPDADAVGRVKNVLGSALAALGDRLFWFTLRPFAACLGVALAASGSRWGALVFWVCYNLLHLGLRGFGVERGYRAGPEVLGGSLRGRLEGVTRLLCITGTALVGVVVAILLVPTGEPRGLVFQVALAGGLTVGLVTAQRARPSPTQWALGVGVLCLTAAWLR